VDIDQRPESIQTRKESGHWEADLMMASDSKHNLLVMHERTSRMTFLHWNTNKKADRIQGILSKRFVSMPESMRQTITFDNGTEFARHYRLRDTLDADLFLPPAQAVAERRGREHQRAHQAFYATKDQARRNKPEQNSAASGHYKLNASKMSWISYSYRGIQQNVALRM